MLMERAKPTPRRTHAGPRVAAMTMRSLTALVGGYAATAGTAAVMARVLPIARVEATMWALILSFLLYSVLGLWAFHEPRLARVSLVIWGLAIFSGGAAWLLGTP